MDYYLELKLIPDPESPAPVLMSALFANLHRVLVSMGEWRVGISFPDVEHERVGLGSRIRLHGTLADLERLMSINWLRGMSDYLCASPVNPVPPNVVYRVVRRVQVKSSPERERRRLIARQGISLEDAICRIPDSSAERIEFPYLTLRSQSTGQQFRLFIEHMPTQSQPTVGVFSAYGLSQVATIPWF